MTVTIAVVAAGAMGSAVAQRLMTAGCTVLTNLDGRSEATRKRALDAGMVERSYADIAQQADVFLSILPPSDSQSLAEIFLANLANKTRTEPILYVDCNAINPVTLKRIAGLFQSNPSVEFVDAAIIGGPPTDGYDPVFYAAADSEKLLDKFAALSAYGLKVSLLTGEGAGLGDASALKMSYAGLTKGTTALFTTMILAAHRSSPATAQALLHELNNSQPEFVKRITRVVPPMLPKAYRWVGEMEEIASFVGQGEGSIYLGAAEVYKRIERGEEEDLEVLSNFVEQAKKL
ncbi:6-phosphogluconate dehydrogenase C-terminal domain-like protein [Mycena floridula]|nr:6-phosphogluconate dehydrogenase C-terminal domain-like protein [Mycena floridula]